MISSDNFDVHIFLQGSSRQWLSLLMMMKQELQV